MNLQSALALHLAVAAMAFVYLRSRVERAFSLTGLALTMLVILHGVPLTVYVLYTGPDSFIFEAALSNVDRESALVHLPLAVALMLVMVIAGIEAAGLAFAHSVRRLRRACRQQPPGVLLRVLRIGPGALLCLWVVGLLMLGVSLAEDQLNKVADYFASGESEIGKILLRVESGGTPYYAYNVLLASVAPFLVMAVGCVALRRSARPSLRWLAALLLLSVLLGKFGTLSKAPPVIFVLQLLLLALLLRRQRLNPENATLLIGAAAALFATTVAFTIPDLDAPAALRYLYYRVFDIPNEVLLEYFAAVPASIPHGGGAGIFAFLRTMPESSYVPMFSAVAEVTRESLLSTSNAMFIGDAWAEFGWPGIVGFSLLAGFVLRSIDLYAFRHGESDESACLVAGGVFGIFTMLSTSLNTALVTGGLSLMPVAAFALSRRLSTRTALRAAHATH